MSTPRTLLEAITYFADLDVATEHFARLRWPDGPKPDATVITDELGSYRGLDEHYQHMVINHAERYADGQVHTNGIENFWALLKRGLAGTYVSVRPFHLFRYLDEQVYRYNRREDEDAERFLGVLVGSEGKRVTWAQLTSKDPKKGAPPPPAPVARRRVLPQRPFRGLTDL
jgi:transposase-like protein